MENNKVENSDKKNNQSTLKKTIKITLYTILSLILVACLVVGGYALYVVCQYKRIDDNIILEIRNNTKEDKVKVNDELTFTSLNIGFGAYSSDYTFFLDEGIDGDGTKHVGHYGRAKSKDEVIKNTSGNIELLKNLDSDFIALQEVDTKATRSYDVNQRDTIYEALNYTYEETYAVNFNSAYLMLPLYQPHGKSLAGLQTFSKYDIKDAMRKSYTVSNAFPDKYFDLDRCFSVNRIAVENGKELVLVNSHMSAYDKGGLIRNKQITELNSFMRSEVDKGNYVVVGGDFNHDLLTYNPLYNYTKDDLPFNDTFTQQVPEWVSFMFNENKKSNFDDDFTIAASSNYPTVRGCDVEYKYGYNYVSSVDGFIISNNVELISVETTKATSNESDMFSFSDHQPTTLKFKLK